MTTQTSDLPDDHSSMDPAAGPEEFGAAGPVGALLERLFHAPERLLGGGRGARDWLPWLVGLTLLCDLGYGLVVGSFAGGAQLWAAPLKLAAGGLLSGLICLPSLFIFSSLSGLRVRLRTVLIGLCAAQALTAVLLIGFAPVAWVFSQSTSSAAFMGALHLGFFALSLAFGLRVLSMSITGKREGQGYLRVWAMLFVLVSLQMTTSLRPLLGSADTLLPQSKKFFLTHWSDELR